MKGSGLPVEARAVDVIRVGVTGTLALPGVTLVSDLRRDHVRLRER